MSWPPNYLKEAIIKYIELEFRPILKKGEKVSIDKLILIASDKTKELELKKQLEIDKEKTEFVTSCLRSPEEFVDLLDDTYHILDEYFEKGSEGEDLGVLFRNFHTLKARFSQYGPVSYTHLTLPTKRIV